MKKHLLILPFLLLGFFGSGCQEPVDPVYYEYLGLWESRHWRIEIYQNGSGVFNSNKLPFQRKIEGRVRINDSKIRIIGDEGRKVFRIDTPPTVEVDPVTGNEYTYMVLDGERVYQTF